MNSKAIPITLGYLLVLSGIYRMTTGEFSKPFSISVAVFVLLSTLADSLTKANGKMDELIRDIKASKIPKHYIQKAIYYVLVLPIKLLVYVLSKNLFWSSIFISVVLYVFLTRYINMNSDYATTAVDSLSLLALGASLVALSWNKE